ncbi:hypothetical protein PFICI_03182 [Pestalotiopsis fici W106-1]|uniref:Methyltransferase n=1 Tax=Pestalotiopsis fici (strain W106-1 / CGMCC3.15140) TaxID=1229662 RepID=W3XI84_PESFW|nr:uncharacterized protein PFICI_03182 [Pestalotiopsis fici W106-1]ETS85157.1 hypothetical protein PFICI_03182 [Pestalotiopsis fici W106-1]
MATADVQLPVVAATMFANVSEASAISPHDVDTILHYFKPNEDNSPPAPTYVGRPETYERPTEEHRVRITDISGQEAQFTLDKNGFQIYKHVSQEKEFVDDDKVKDKYYKETEQLLKDATGASRIFIFDHTIRRPDPDQTNTTSPIQLRGPVNRVHIDQTYEAALSRVPHHLPNDADELLKGRVQIINVWRPIKTVLRDPLALAEANSVEEDDLVPIGLIYPNRKGATFAVKGNDKHKWYFKYGLTPEEVILIKCFDSKTDGRARRVPHTAFVDSGAGDDVPARESIEVRALVFHEHDRE